MGDPRNSAQIGGKRVYRVPDLPGTTFPSVTTILDAYPKEWLGAWAAKMVAQYAVESWEALSLLEPEARIKDMKGAPWRKRDAAAEHGTEVHETFEAINAGLPFSVPANMAPHISQLQAWAGAFRPKPIWSEVQVYNHEEGYAGTFDLYAEVAGRNLLIDLKTSKEASPHSWALQLAAYGFTDLVASGDDILARPALRPWPDGYAVLWVPREKPDRWQFIELPITSFTYEVFLAVKRVYEYREAKPAAEILLPVAMEAPAA